MNHRPIYRGSATSEHNGHTATSAAEPAGNTDDETVGESSTVGEEAAANLEGGQADTTDGGDGNGDDGLDDPEGDQHLRSGN